ncbi:MAG: hypothetical protein M3R52_05260 [Acidobacteriota bacterium]|nr:hypothetical protein [Acidobacteriota bacterium]
MVTLLFTAIFIIGLLAITLYFWVPRLKSSDENLLPPPDPPRGLFSDDDGFVSFLQSPAISGERETERISLSERARAGDKSALREAQALGDQKFYNEVLDQLAANADRAPTLLALVSYVTRNALPVNSKLAEAVIRSWKSSPDRSSTATTLHLTALADDADLYQSTVEAALHFWRQGLLAGVSAAELRALFDGEFWVLSARTRNSGSGFVLKRTLANVRRELETAMRVN